MSMVSVIFSVPKSWQERHCVSSITRGMAVTPLWHDWQVVPKVTKSLWSISRPRYFTISEGGVWHVRQRYGGLSSEWLSIMVLCDCGEMLAEANARLVVSAV